MTELEESVEFFASFLMLLGIICAVLYGPLAVFYGILYLLAL